MSLPENRREETHREKMMKVMEEAETEGFSYKSENTAGHPSHWKLRVMEQIVLTAWRWNPPTPTLISDLWPPEL